MNTLLLGVRPDQPPELSKKIRLTNGIALLCGATTVPFMLLDALIGQWSMVGVNALWAAFFFGVLLFNHLGRTTLSRWCLIVFGNVTILAAGFAFGRPLGLEPAFLVGACLPFLLFEHRVGAQRYIGSLLAAGMYLFLELWGYEHSLGVALGKMTLQRPLEMLVCMALLVAMVRYLQVLNARSEAELAGALEALKNNQAQMIHSARMSALGEIAGGIAHEINNPMCAAQLQLDALSRRLPEPGLQKLEGHIRRVTRIVNGLLLFARDAEHDAFESAPISKIIEETMELCHQRFDARGIQLEVSNVPSDLSVNCRPAQISQVILNLLNNAYDAVADVSEKKVTLEVTESPESVQLTVKDNGPGIPEALRSNIFRPFFTTKPVGKGTGLGLSVSLGIIAAHHGVFELERADPGDTRFVVRLPRRA